MYILRLTLILVGLIFIGFGYAIWLKGKYNLINNFQTDKKKGKLNDSYAKRVGIIEFIGGILCIALGIVSIFMNDTFTLIAFILCIIGIIIGLAINQVKSSKESKIN